MNRIRSADTFRVLAIVAVIALHTAPHDGVRAVGHGWDLPTSFNLRDGPFFSLVFFITGAELRRRALPATPWPGLLLALAGFALQLLELRWLHLRFGAPLVQDYVASTWLYGLGTGLMALSDAPALRRPAPAALGPLVLGIYASHYLFVDWLRPFDDVWRAWPAWDVLYVVLVFAGALLLTRLLARWSPGRRLVM